MPKLLSIPSILAGVAASALLLVGSPAAYAAPGTCTNTACSGGRTSVSTSLIDARGATVTPVGGSGVFDCIRQQDKLFSAFQLRRRCQLAACRR